MKRSNMALKSTLVNGSDSTFLQEHHDHVAHAQERSERHVNHPAGRIRPSQAFHVDLQVWLFIEPDEV
jgi:hypothetical protein